MGHLWGTDRPESAVLDLFSGGQSPDCEPSAVPVGRRWSRGPRACLHGAGGRSIDLLVSGEVSRQCPASPWGKKKATHDFSQVADL